MVIAVCANPSNPDSTNPDSTVLYLLCTDENGPYVDLLSLSFFSRYLEVIAL